MQVNKLKRDPIKVKKAFTEKGDQLLAKSECFILIPASFTGKGLSKIGASVHIIGIFAIFIDDVTYAVSTVPSMMDLGPCDNTLIEVDGEDYLKFTFPKGGVVIKNTNLIQDKKITNSVMTLFIDRGKIPWFMNLVDTAEIFSQSKQFNNITLGKSQAIMDIVVSAIARNPKDLKQYYRHAMKSDSDITGYPAFIPLRDIAMNATSNLARVNGNELKQGLKAAVLSEPDRVEPLEELLKS